LFINTCICEADVIKSPKKEGIPMKYINQLDYPDMQYITQVANPDPKMREVGINNTVAKSGCGLCSSVMIADRLLSGVKFEIEDARQLSYDSGANQWSGTRGVVYFPAFAEKFNLELVISKDIEDLLRCLRTGGAAAVLVSGDHDDYHGVFSDRWSHYIVAVAEERDGRIAVLDAAYEEGAYEKGDRKGKVEVISRGFSRVSQQVIQEETAAIENRFFLFWRK